MIFTRLEQGDALVTQLAVNRNRQVRRVLADEPRLAAREARPGERIRPGLFLGLAVTLGLVTGLLELVAHGVRGEFFNSTSLGALQLNQHAIWMVPVSDALVFGSCGLILAALARLTRARWVTFLGVYGLSFLAAFAFLLTSRA